MIEINSCSATVAFIALGSNLGDREGNIARAVELLGRMPGVEVVAVSRLLDNPAVGGPEGSPAFLNGAAKLRTTLTPVELLDALLAVEKQLGRTREVHWGPRTIDLDLLLYGDTILQTPQLTLPHPRMHERDFVLRPLAEIAGDVVHPVLLRSIADLLAALSATPLPHKLIERVATSSEKAVASIEQSPDNGVMDLSKLPRLSHSKGQVPGEALPAAGRLPEAEPAPSQPVVYNTEPPVGLGEVGNIWLSLIIGVVVMLMGLNFAKWAMATLLGQTYDTGYLWPDGRPVAYWELQGHTAISDSALFLFGLACVLEAAAMAAAHARPRLRTATVSVALLTTLLATAYNAVACVVLFRDNVTPLLSLLAVGFGGYMAFAEWGMLRSRR